MAAEWNPFRNCQPPCPTSPLPTSSFPPTAFPQENPPVPLSLSTLLLSFSSSFSAARLLSSLPPEGSSVLVSNTDIEQSPFSLKPSSHQE